MSDKFSTLNEAEKHGYKWGYYDGRNAGILIGMIIAVIFYFVFMAKNTKYEGLTANEWADQYYSLTGCIEDQVSYQENPMDCL